MPMYLRAKLILPLHPPHPPPPPPRTHAHTHTPQKEPLKIPPISD